jgi:hypothetical protein
LEGKLRDNGMEVPINRTRPFAARTDAENGYLIRDDNPGRLYISDEGLRDKFVIRQSLRDGRLTVFLQPLADRVRPGDAFVFEVGLHDPAMPGPVTDTLTIRIAEAATDDPLSPKPPKKPSKPVKQGSEPDIGMPEYLLLTKDGRAIPGHPTDHWPEDFTDDDGGLVKDLGQGRKLYKINYDNRFHLAYRQRQRGEVNRDSISQKYIIGMRLLMLGLEHAMRGASNGANGSNKFAELEDDIRRLAANGAAATVLAVADHLPKLMEPLGGLVEPE